MITIIDNCVKPIYQYEGHYLINKLGEIFSIKNNHKKIVTFAHKNGYICVNLSKNGVKKQHLLHRLLAQSFIQNTNNYKEVNHINGIKHDNDLNNLEWCTRSQNAKHLYSVLGCKMHNKGKNADDSHLSKRILATKGSETLIFNSITTAAKSLSINRSNLYSFKTEKTLKNGWTFKRI